MSHCPNCKTYLSCTCQKATANDGKVVCTNCVSSYNLQLVKTTPNKNKTGIAPTNVSAKANPR